MLRFAANLSLLFAERPMLERFAAARAAGFDAVEIQFPYEHDPERIAQAAHAAGVEVVLINAPVTDDGRFGIACRPDRREEFRTGLELAARYAQTLGAKRVNVLTGLPGSHASSACRAALVANLMLAAERLEGIADVLLEPINAYDVPGYFIDSVAAARKVIAACAGRVGLQFDVYHVVRMGLEPRDELLNNLDIVRHVQFADAPGRHEPGTGRIDFAPLWTLLDKASYAGFVAAEYRPSGDTRSSFGWLDAWRAELVRTRDSR